MASQYVSAISYLEAAQPGLLTPLFGGSSAADDRTEEEQLPLPSGRNSGGQEEESGRDGVAAIGGPKKRHAKRPEDFFAELAASPTGRRTKDVVATKPKEADVEVEIQLPENKGSTCAADSSPPKRSRPPEKGSCAADSSPPKRSTPQGPSLDERNIKTASSTPKISKASPVLSRLDAPAQPSRSPPFVFYRRRNKRKASHGALSFHVERRSNFVFLPEKQRTGDAAASSSSSSSSSSSNAGDIGAPSSSSAPGGDVGPRLEIKSSDVGRAPNQVPVFKQPVSEGSPTANPIPDQVPVVSSSSSSKSSSYSSTTSSSSIPSRDDLVARIEAARAGTTRPLRSKSNDTSKTTSVSAEGLRGSGCNLQSTGKSAVIGTTMSGRIEQLASKGARYAAKKDVARENGPGFKFKVPLSQRPAWQDVDTSSRPPPQKLQSSKNPLSPDARMALEDWFVAAAKNTPSGPSPDWGDDDDDSDEGKQGVARMKLRGPDHVDKNVANNASENVDDAVVGDHGDVTPREQEARGRSVSYGEGGHDSCPSNKLESDVAAMKTSEQGQQHQLGNRKNKLVEQGGFTSPTFGTPYMQQLSGSTLSPSVTVSPTLAAPLVNIAIPGSSTDMEELRKQIAALEKQVKKSRSTSSGFVEEGADNDEEEKNSSGTNEIGSSEGSSANRSRNRNANNTTKSLSSDALPRSSTRLSSNARSLVRDEDSEHIPPRDSRDTRRTAKEYASAAKYHSIAGGESERFSTSQVLRQSPTTRENASEVRHSSTTRDSSSPLERDSRGVFSQKTQRDGMMKDFISSADPSMLRGLSQLMQVLGLGNADSRPGPGGIAEMDSSSIAAGANPQLVPAPHNQHPLGHMFAAYAKEQMPETKTNEKSASTTERENLQEERSGSAVGDRGNTSVDAKNGMGETAADPTVGGMITFLDPSLVQRDKENFLRQVLSFVGGEMHSRLRDKDDELTHLRKVHRDQVEALEKEIREMAEDSARRETRYQRHIKKLDLQKKQTEVDLRDARDEIHQLSLSGQEAQNLRKEKDEVEEKWSKRLETYEKSVKELDLELKERDKSLRAQDDKLQELTAQCERVTWDKRKLEERLSNMLNNGGRGATGVEHLLSSESGALGGAQAGIGFVRSRSGSPAKRNLQRMVPPLPQYQHAESSESSAGQKTPPPASHFTFYSEPQQDQNANGYHDRNNAGRSTTATAIALAPPQTSHSQVQVHASSSSLVMERLQLDLDRERLESSKKLFALEGERDRLAADLRREREDRGDELRREREARTRELEQVEEGYRKRLDPAIEQKHREIQDDLKEQIRLLKTELQDRARELLEEQREGGRLRKAYTRLEREMESLETDLMRALSGGGAGGAGGGIKNSKWDEVKMLSRGRETIDTGGGPRQKFPGGPERRLNHCGGDVQHQNHDERVRARSHSPPSMWPKPRGFSKNQEGGPPLMFYPEGLDTVHERKVVVQFSSSPTASTSSQGVEGLSTRPPVLLSKLRQNPWFWKPSKAAADVIQVPFSPRHKRAASVDSRHETTGRHVRVEQAPVVRRPAPLMRRKPNSVREDEIAALQRDQHVWSATCATTISSSRSKDNKTKLNYHSRSLNPKQGCPTSATMGAAVQTRDASRAIDAVRDLRLRLNAAESRVAQLEAAEWREKSNSGLEMRWREMNGEKSVSRSIDALEQQRGYVPTGADHEANHDYNFAPDDQLQLREQGCTTYLGAPEGSGAYQPLLDYRARTLSPQASFPLGSRSLAPGNLASSSRSRRAYSQDRYFPQTRQSSASAGSSWRQSTVRRGELLTVRHPQRFDNNIASSTCRKFVSSPTNRNGRLPAFRARAAAMMQRLRSGITDLTSQPRLALERPSLESGSGNPGGSVATTSLVFPGGPSEYDENSSDYGSRKRQRRRNGTSPPSTSGGGGRLAFAFSTPACRTRLDELYEQELDREEDAFRSRIQRFHDAEQRELADIAKRETEEAKKMEEQFVLEQEKQLQREASRRTSNSVPDYLREGGGGDNSSLTAAKKELRQPLLELLSGAAVKTPDGGGAKSISKQSKNVQPPTVQQPPMHFASGGKNAAQQSSASGGPQTTTKNVGLVVDGLLGRNLSTSDARVAMQRHKFELRKRRELALRFDPERERVRQKHDQERQRVLDEHEGWLDRFSRRRSKELHSLHQALDADVKALYTRFSQHSSAEHSRHFVALAEKTVTELEELRRLHDLEVESLGETNAIAIAEKVNAQTASTTADLERKGEARLEEAERRLQGEKTSLENELARVRAQLQAEKSCTEEVLQLLKDRDFAVKGGADPKLVTEFLLSVRARSTQAAEMSLLAHQAGGGGAACIGASSGSTATGGLPLMIPAQGGLAGATLVQVLQPVGTGGTMVRTSEQQEQQQGNEDVPLVKRGGVAAFTAVLPDGNKTTAPASSSSSSSSKESRTPDAKEKKTKKKKRKGSTGSDESAGSDHNDEAPEGTTEGKKASKARKKDKKQKTKKSKKSRRADSADEREEESPGKSPRPSPRANVGDAASTAPRDKAEPEQGSSPFSRRKAELEVDFPTSSSNSLPPPPRRRNEEMVEEEPKAEATSSFKLPPAVEMSASTSCFVASPVRAVQPSNSAHQLNGLMLLSPVVTSMAQVQAPPQPAPRPSLTGGFAGIDREKEVQGLYKQLGKLQEDLAKSNADEARTEMDMRRAENAEAKKDVQMLALVRRERDQLLQQLREAQAETHKRDLDLLSFSRVQNRCDELDAEKAALQKSFDDLTATLRTTREEAFEKLMAERKKHEKDVEQRLFDARERLRADFEEDLENLKEKHHHEVESLQEKLQTTEADLAKTQEMLRAAAVLESAADAAVLQSAVGGDAASALQSVVGAAATATASSNGRGEGHQGSVPLGAGALVSQVQLQQLVSNRQRMLSHFGATQRSPQRDLFEKRTGSGLFTNDVLGGGGSSGSSFHLPSSSSSSASSESGGRREKRDKNARSSHGEGKSPSRSIGGGRQVGANASAGMQTSEPMAQAELIAKLQAEVGASTAALEQERAKRMQEEQLSAMLMTRELEEMREQEANDQAAKLAAKRTKGHEDADLISRIEEVQSKTRNRGEHGPGSSSRGLLLDKNLKSVAPVLGEGSASDSSSASISEDQHRKENVIRLQSLKEKKSASRREKERSRRREGSTVAARKADVDITHGVDLQDRANATFNEKVQFVDTKSVKENASTKTAPASSPAEEQAEEQGSLAKSFLRFFGIGYTEPDEDTSGSDTSIDASVLRSSDAEGEEDSESSWLDEIEGSLSSKRDDLPAFFFSPDPKDGSRRSGTKSSARSEASAGDRTEYNKLMAHLKRPGDVEASSVSAAGSGGVSGSDIDAVSGSAISAASSAVSQSENGESEVPSGVRKKQPSSRGFAFAVEEPPVTVVTFLQSSEDDDFTPSDVSGVSHHRMEPRVKEPSSAASPSKVPSTGSSKRPAAEGRGSANQNHVPEDSVLSSKGANVTLDVEAIIAQESRTSSSGAKASSSSQQRARGNEQRAAASSKTSGTNPGREDGPQQVVSSKGHAVRSQSVRDQEPTRREQSAKIASESAKNISEGSNRPQKETSLRSGSRGTASRGDKAKIVGEEIEFARTIGPGDPLLHQQNQKRSAGKSSTQSSSVWRKEVDAPIMSSSLAGDLNIEVQNALKAALSGADTSSRTAFAERWGAVVTDEERHALLDDLATILIKVSDEDMRLLAREVPSLFEVSRMQRDAGSGLTTTHSNVSPLTCALRTVEALRTKLNEAAVVVRKRSKKTRQGVAAVKKLKHALVKNREKRKALQQRAQVDYEQIARRIEATLAKGSEDSVIRAWVAAKTHEIHTKSQKLEQDRRQFEEAQLRFELDFRAAQEKGDSAQRELTRLQTQLAAESKQRAKEWKSLRKEKESNETARRELEVASKVKEEEIVSLRDKVVAAAATKVELEQRSKELETTKQSLTVVEAECERLQRELLATQKAARQLRAVSEVDSLAEQTERNLNLQELLRVQELALGRAAQRDADELRELENLVQSAHRGLHTSLLPGFEAPDEAEGGRGLDDVEEEDGDEEEDG
ncbi:unnamed protein product [Amoebophrya sp. A25]|nr:unnamed protein product [Amoebophrya sp. A25]|eukprot:GSA25T00009087001.1